MKPATSHFLHHIEAGGFRLNPYTVGILIPLFSSLFHVAYETCEQIPLTDSTPSLDHHYWSRVIVIIFPSFYHLPAPPKDHLYRMVKEQVQQYLTKPNHCI